jgi:hypothetical protein
VLLAMLWRFLWHEVGCHGDASAISSQQSRELERMIVRVLRRVQCEA